jgi:ABC-type uncharacterized transport system involved in gliding motility auxiliary subunit
MATPRPHLMVARSFPSAGAEDGNDGVLSEPLQGTPANPRTAEREKCLVDVGPFVVPDAEPAKLIEPGKCPLDHPAPLPQTAAVRGAAHSQQRQDVTRAQAVPDGGRVIAAVAEHADRPASGSAAFALQWRNRINQGQSFLRVVSIGTGQADRERDALSITDQMPFAPALGAIGGIRTS